MTSTDVISKACEYLIAKAYPAYNKDTCGKCAAAIRNAFDFALKKPIERTESAKDYGPIYENLGFKKIFTYPIADKKLYQSKMGDICIIQYEPHGHICVNTPKGWISDFKQNDMYGGKIRDKDPHFDIYRL